MIEQTLSDLTTAIRDLTAAILAGGNSATATATAPVTGNTSNEAEAEAARTRRTRRTKAEMEAAKAQEQAADPKGAPEQEEAVEGDFLGAGEEADDLFDMSPSLPEPEPEPPATLDDARGVVMRVAQFIGREAGAKLVAEFGASKLGDIKPEQYAALVSRGEVLITQHKHAKAAG